MRGPEANRPAVPAAGARASRRPRPRAVLLDALGTLVRMAPPAPLLRSALAGAGFDVGEAAARAAFRAEIAFYLDHHLEGSDPAALDRLRDRCADVLRACLEVPGLDRATARAAMLAAIRFEAHPDAAPALRALRGAGLRLVAASNWDCSLPAVLRGAGLHGLLDGVAASAAVGAAKPDGRLFLAALSLAGAEPEEALHVGDSAEHDVTGARAAGLAAVLLDRTGREPAVDAPVIRSLAELPSLVFEGR